MNNQLTNKEINDYFNNIFNNIEQTNIKRNELWRLLKNQYTTDFIRYMGYGWNNGLCKKSDYIKLYKFAMTYKKFVAVLCKNKYSLEEVFNSKINNIDDRFYKVKNNMIMEPWYNHFRSMKYDDATIARLWGEFWADLSYYEDISKKAYENHSLDMLDGLSMFDVTEKIYDYDKYVINGYLHNLYDIQDLFIDIQDHYIEILNDNGIDTIVKNDYGILDGIIDDNEDIYIDCLLMDLGNNSIARKYNKYNDITEDDKLEMIEDISYNNINVHDTIYVLSHFLEYNNITLLNNLANIDETLDDNPKIVWLMSKMINDYEQKFISSKQTMGGIKKGLLKKIDKDELNNMMNHIKYKPGSKWFHETKDKWNRL